MAALILDSSVILAAILGERGGDAVFESLDEAAVSTVNVAEVYSYAAINALPVEAIDAFLEETGIEIVPFAQDQAVLTGHLATKTRKAGLSLGDRACLALAALRKAEVLTADHAWERVAGDVGVRVTMLR